MPPRTETQDPLSTISGPGQPDRRGRPAGVGLPGVAHDPDRSAADVVPGHGRDHEPAAAGVSELHIALVGVVVTGPPTLPFLLLAAWAASRGSKRVHDWLYDHPRFGPSLTRWRDEKAISQRARITAVGLIIGSWLILLWRGGDARLLLPLAVLFTGVSTFLLTRPEPADRPRSPGTVASWPWMNLPSNDLMTSVPERPPSPEPSGSNPEPDGRPASASDPATGPVRWVYALLAYLFTAIALLGVVVPGLPTFPFLLLAAWAASRGSQRVHDWLYDHPRFGPSLTRWRDEKAISRSAKITAVGLIIASWLILLWRVGDARLLLPLAVLFTAVSTFLLTRPEPADPDS